MVKKFNFFHFLFLGLLSLFFTNYDLAAQSGGHKAHHGGVLNVIGEESGHVEVLIREDLLEAWFVGGGQDTGRSVPLEATEIFLEVTIPQKGIKKLVLKAHPMKLAGEKIGHCSHFVARAEWLRGVKEFVAQGEIVFKGVRHKLLIKYPHGHDPFHDFRERKKKDDRR